MSDEKDWKEKDFERAPEDASFSQFVPSDNEVDQLLANLGAPVSTPAASSVPTITVPVEEELPVVPVDPVEARERDFNLARANIKEVITKTKTALDDMMDLASNAQHPRAYEVLTLMVNSMIEANQKLLDLHKQKQFLELKDAERNLADKGKQSGNVTNNLFVGTTAQLDELMKTLKAKKNE